MQGVTLSKWLKPFIYRCFRSCVTPCDTCDTLYLYLYIFILVVEVGGVFGANINTLV